MEYIFKHCVSNNVIETIMCKCLLCEVKLQNGKIISANFLTKLRNVYALSIIIGDDDIVPITIQTLTDFGLLEMNKIDEHSINNSNICNDTSEIDMASTLSTDVKIADNEDCEATTIEDQ